MNSFGNAQWAKAERRDGNTVFGPMANLCFDGWANKVDLHDVGDVDMFLSFPFLGEKNCQQRCTAECGWPGSLSMAQRNNCSS